MAAQKEVLEEINGQQRYVILAVHADDEPILGRDRLQHIVFLASREVDAVGKLFKFTSGDSGPYSEAVDKEFDRAVRAGIIADRDGGIEIAAGGRKTARALRRQEDEFDMLGIIVPKRTLTDITPDQSLSYIYSAYPEMAKGPKYEELKPHIEDHVFSLLAMGKINSQDARKFLGKDIAYVVAKMKELGIGNE